MQSMQQGAPPPVPARGTLLAGRFRVDDILGEGGMATVVRAVDVATGRVLAIKLLRPEIAKRPEAVERFRREGEVLTALKHPSIVEIETFGALPDGTLFLAMELLDGETLGARLRRGRMDPRELAPILAGTTAGLAAAHARGIIHRDLKPENLFLAKVPGAHADEPPRVKILDFGISKVYGNDRLTATGELVGTPRYMAPEQMAGDLDVDVRIDVYALGVILYEALAGRPPFLAASSADLIVAIAQGKVTPLRAARPDVGAPLEAVVMRAMAKAREARYGSVTELAEAYLDASGVLQGGGGARPGMLTAPMGGQGAKATQLVGSLGPLPELVTSAPTTEDLRPGTFSALQAFQIASPITPPPVVPGLSPAPVPAIPPTALHPQVSLEDITGKQRTEGGDTVRERGKRGPAPRQELPAHSPAVSSASVRDLEHDLVSKSRNGGRLGVLLFALVAGGLSAAAVVFALQWYASRAAAPPAHTGPSAVLTPAASLDPPRGGGAATGELPVGAPTPGPEHAPVVPSPVVPSLVEPVAPIAPTPTPIEPSPIEPRPDTPHRRPRNTPDPSPVQPTVVTPTPTPAPVDPNAPRTPIELLQDARAALGRGDAHACADLATRAVQAGAPSAALRLQGDCLRRDGNLPGALAAYERFCRLAPDHPAIGDVRAILEANGRACN